LRILLVEDDEALATALTRALERRGIRSDWAASLGDGAQMAASAQYAALLLDLGLPDGDGLALLRQLRSNRDRLPIIAITARGAVGDRVSGLNLGLDDYLVKPFDVDELVARLQAVFRRQGPFPSNAVEVGNVGLDVMTRDVFVGGARLDLSRRERELAELLLRRAGQVVSRQLAEDQLFGLSSPPGSNAVEVYAHRLRRKLEGAGADVRIQTIKGLGYLLQGAR
jgi:two-component system response regulator TctD